MIRPRLVLPGLVVSAILALVVVACDGEVTSDTATPDAGTSSFDAAPPVEADGSSPGRDAGDPPTPDAGADAGKILAPGLYGPVAYTSRADSPFQGVVLSAYDHFEDWEDDMVNTPGVTPSSTELGSAFGQGLIDAVDGDDGVVDGKCEGCQSGFANGTIEFTFDAALLGALPTHVGIVWTDGSPGCDAIFEAYDSTDTLIGTRTADAVGDGSNLGTVEEDRWFGVVHAAGVKRIVVKSSAGGVEVDHLHYGR